MYFEKIVEELGAIEKVRAIALAGSRAAGTSDKASDYDVYVYCRDVLSVDEKRSILEKYCNTMEISNQYWELEDNCVLKDGIPIDIIYRNPIDFTKQLEYVVEGCNPFNGYTTCFWHNLLSCEILIDKDGWLREQKKRFDISYPPKLKQNIIERNMKLLSGVLPSYDLQIKKACKRGDTVSINHRVAEFLASYFDVIFALNEIPHPGEKRLVSLCKQRCKILPKNFEENLNRLFSTMFSDFDTAIIHTMVDELRAVIR